MVSHTFTFSGRWRNRTPVIRTEECRIYPNKSQAAQLATWMHASCRTFNAGLEHRIKAYSRRKESVTYCDQTKLLTVIRQAKADKTPALVQRFALQKLERAFRSFFDRIKRGEKAGFPRFKSSRRWTTIEFGAKASYVRNQHLRIPCLGMVRQRGLRKLPSLQKVLRIIKRASGWYAQLVYEKPSKKLSPIGSGAIGIDVGLSHFATLSSGETIANPRFFLKKQAKIAKAQRRLSRKRAGSMRRKKALRVVGKLYEQVQCDRKDFLHKTSRSLVSRFASLAVEDLDIAGMRRTRFAKSIADVAWASFIFYLTYKAEEAGGQVVKVNPRGTTQLCSSCGQHVKKTIADRVHSCGCGLTMDRDWNAALNILDRGFPAVRGATCVEACSYAS